MHKFILAFALAFAGSVSQVSIAQVDEEVIPPECTAAAAKVDAVREKYGKARCWESEATLASTKCQKIMTERRQVGLEAPASCNYQVHQN